MADTPASASSPAPDPKSAAPAAASGAPAAPQPPSSRDLRPPHFLLHAPDGLTSYFERENYRVVMASQEPLAAFLAPANLIDDKAPAPGRARQRIEYDFSGIDMATVAPLEAVPSTLLAAFEQAVRAFYSRVDDPASKATDHEKRLRKGFRLPDPDREKDAYWVHGPRDDRKLLVLWGCEAVRSTAIPLCARPEAGNTAGVLEKLRKRGMPWAIMQREAVALVIEKRRPLSRFIATPVRDRAGAITAVIHKGKNIPRAELKPLDKNLRPGVLAAFEREAAEFYVGARNDAPDISAYEKELRRAVRLPDPAKRGAQYVLHGGNLLIVVQGDETANEVLCPGSDAEIPIPPEETGPDGAKYVPETVVDKLRSHLVSYKKFVILGAAAAVVIAGVAIALGVGKDRTPPRVVVQSDTEMFEVADTPQLVRVPFDEKLDPVSVSDKDELGAEKPVKPFQVQSRDGGHFLATRNPRLDPQDPSVVLLDLEASMTEGNYVVVMNGVSDLKGNVVNPNTEARFRFGDRTPPAFDPAREPSADPDSDRRLVVFFTEPLNADNPGTFRIDGFEVQDAKLDPRDPSAVVVTVDKPLQNGESYNLRARVADASRNRNLMQGPDDGPVAKIFRYMDTVPPSLVGAPDAVSQVKVQLKFSEKLGESAASAGLFTLHEVEGGPPKPVEVTRVRTISEGRALELSLAAPLRGGNVVYRLAARDVPDLSGNAFTTAEPVEFRFSGQADTTKPRIAEARVRRDTANRDIEVRFSEEVRLASADRPEAYTILDTEAAVDEIIPVESGDAVQQVVVRLKAGLPAGKPGRLRVTGLTDLVGNKEDAAEFGPITPFGTVMWDTGLEVTSARAESPIKVVIEFNDAVDAAAARERSNYAVLPDRRVAGVEVTTKKVASKDVTVVTLTLERGTPLEAGKSYGFKAVNLRFAGTQRLQRDISAPIAR